MGRTILEVAGLLVASAWVTAGCTGGCYSVADPVQTNPKNDCLSLYGGQSPNDPTVCAVPQLDGVNQCDAALTLPKRSDSDVVTVVAPGDKITWPIPAESVPPSITVIVQGHAASYVIDAMLGTEPVTITVPVHDE